MIAPEHDDIICCTGVMSWPHSSSLDDIVVEDRVVDAVVIVEQNLFFQTVRVTVSQSLLCRWVTRLLLDSSVATSFRNSVTVPVAVVFEFVCVSECIDPA